MANPITGPIIGQFSAGSSLGKGAMYERYQRYRQAKPYDLPLPYYKFTRRITTCSLPGGACWGNAENYAGIWRNPANFSSDWAFTAFEPGDETVEIVRALNKAREKFMDEVNPRTEQMVNLLQGRQTVDMIANRLLSFGRAHREFKRGSWSTAWRLLTTANPKLSGHHYKTPKGWRNNGRDLGSVWLEYSYGWKPLLSDIWDGVKILSTGFDPKSTEVHVKEPVDYKFTRVDHTVNGGDLVTSRFLGKVKATVGGTVTITNPNLHLAASMGLTNPLSWAWEDIPFSFVVDWFVDIGGYLNSLDDMLGLALTGAYYSRTWDVSYDLRYSFPAFGQFSQCVGQVTQTKRALGLPPFRMVRSRTWLSNLPRALNASSLLLQSLRGH